MKLQDGVGHEEFWSAVMAGDVPVVRQHLQMDPERARWRNAQGQTPLILAAQQQDVEMGKLLLAHSEIDAQDASEQDALLWSIRPRQNKEALALFRLLVEHGDGNKVYPETGWTALLYAVHRGTPQMVQVLAECSDPNFQGRRGESALTMAVDSHQVEKVAVLLPLSTIDQDQEQKDPLLLRVIGHAAAQTNAARSVELLRLLLPHRNPTVRDLNGQTVLMAAAQSGDVPSTQLLLSVLDAQEVLVQDRSGRDACVKAEEQGHLAVVDCFASFLPFARVEALIEKCLLFNVQHQVPQLMARLEHEKIKEALHEELGDQKDNVQPKTGKSMPNRGSNGLSRRL